MKIILNIIMLSCLAIASHSYSMENNKRGRSKSVPTNRYINPHRRKQAKTPESNRSVKTIEVARIDEKGYENILLSTCIHPTTTVDHIYRILEGKFGSMDKQQLHAVEKHLLSNGKYTLIPSKPLSNEINISTLMNGPNGHKVEKLLLIKVK